jgi:hypothetical protein
MPRPCPSCSSLLTTTSQSVRLRDSRHRRRHICKACNHRWTTWEGTSQPYERKPSPRRKGRIPDETIARILEDNRSLATWALELGVSRELIRKIRVGGVYRLAMPDLLRRNNAASCHQCQHWVDGSCGYGFPDPLEEGPSFAAECHLFEARARLKAA